MKDDADPTITKQTVEIKNTSQKSAQVSGRLHVSSVQSAVSLYLGCFLPPRGQKSLKFQNFQNKVFIEQTQEKPHYSHELEIAFRLTSALFLLLFLRWQRSSE